MFIVQMARENPGGLSDMPAVVRNAEGNLVTGGDLPMLGPRALWPWRQALRR